jgi:outer membrane protein insertion porin family
MRSGAVERYQLSYFEPYLTDEGIGIGYDIQHSKFDAGDNNLASYFSSTDAFDIYLGVPISESDTINAQMGLSKTSILAAQNFGTPQSIIDYIDNIGQRTFHTWNVQLSWAHDTRNRYWNPTRGGLQQVSVEVTLPGSTVEYYKVNYHWAQYLRMTDKLIFYPHLTFGYGNTYNAPESVLDPTHPRYRGNLGGLPFFDDFYAGGVSDVRGFRDNTLGPFDVNGSNCPPTNANCRLPLGGALKFAASAEVIFPTPFVKENNDSTRVSAFIDVGNVFQNKLCRLPECRVYKSWAADQLRASVGLSFQWRAPVGPIVINLAKPIRKKPGDDTETIQFTFGNTF